RPRALVGADATKTLSTGICGRRPWPTAFRTGERGSAHRPFPHPSSPTHRLPRRGDGTHSLPCPRAVPACGAVMVAPGSRSYSSHARSHGPFGAPLAGGHHVRRKWGQDRSASVACPPSFAVPSPGWTPSFLDCIACRRFEAVVGGDQGRCRGFTSLQAERIVIRWMREVDPYADWGCKRRRGRSLPSASDGEGTTAVQLRTW